MTQSSAKGLPSSNIDAEDLSLTETGAKMTIFVSSSSDDDDEF